MNRFYDTPGDVSMQLSPWELKARGFVNPKHAIFLLQKEIRFRSDIAFGGDIVVPPGFLSDLASIPRVAWSLFMAPDDPRIELGGWVHDFLYANVGDVFIENVKVAHPLTRDECDRILAFEAMAELGASKFQQYGVYLMLRLFGAGSFNTAPPTVRWKFVNVVRGQTLSTPPVAGPATGKGSRNP
jgi:hypothetical protein